MEQRERLPDSKSMHQSNEIWMQQWKLNNNWTSLGYKSENLNNIRL
jgi:hypothetical protein